MDVQQIQTTWSEKMNNEQVRKRIVYEVMNDLKSTPAFVSVELKIIRKSLNKCITRVLSVKDDFEITNKRDIPRREKKE